MKYSKRSKRRVYVREWDETVADGGPCGWFSWHANYGGNAWPRAGEVARRQPVWAIACQSGVERRRRRRDVLVPVDGGTSTTVRRVDGPAAITGRRRLRVPRPSIRNRTARSFATAVTRTQVVVVWPRWDMLAVFFDSYSETLWWFKWERKSDGEGRPRLSYIGGSSRYDWLTTGVNLINNNNKKMSLK